VPIAAISSPTAAIERKVQPRSAVLVMEAPHSADDDVRGNAARGIVIAMGLSAMLWAAIAAAIF
jgi:hypothetical protein